MVGKYQFQGRHHQRHHGAAARLYLPPAPTKAKQAPLLIYIHGGAFRVSHPLQPGLPQPPQRSLRLGQRRRGVGLLDGLELGGDELPGDATPVRSVTGSPTDVAASQRPTLPTKPPPPSLPPRLRRLLGKHAAAPAFGAAKAITLFPLPTGSPPSPRRPPRRRARRRPPPPHPNLHPLLSGLGAPSSVPRRRRPPTPNRVKFSSRHGALHVVLPPYRSSTAHTPFFARDCQPCLFRFSGSSMFIVGASNASNTSYCAP
ncbi:hypothetical protein Fmac_006359 [Flemingia macrophylla]|uniref:Alpha/beta hydrolase fold-3 domain-containing protein n=1 Tax=Flemingia macrophylla TaxID=520843 RepID=A0ABD1NAH4_9FABA